MKRLIACFVIGMLLGGVLALVALAKRMDDLYILNKELLLEQEETKAKINMLEGRLAEYHRLIVVGIDFRFEVVPDTLERLTLEKQLRTVANSLLGQPVREIRLETAIALLDGRIVTVDERFFKVGVKAVVLAERVTYYLRITTHTVNIDDEH